MLVGIGIGVLGIILIASVFANVRQYKKQQILEEENENLAERVEQREDQMFEFAQRVVKADKMLKKLDTKHNHYEKDEELGFFYRSVEQMIERLKMFEFVEEAPPEEQAEHEFNQLNNQVNKIFENSTEERKQDPSWNAPRQQESSQEQRERRSFIPKENPNKNDKRRVNNSYGKEKEDQEREDVFYKRDRTSYNRLHRLRRSSGEE